LAVLLAYAGDQARASATLSDALLLAEETDESVRARTYGRAAAVAFFAGDEHSVELYANEAARLAEDCSLYGLAARIGTSLSALHTSAGRIAIAKSYAARIVSNAERAGDPEVRARGLRELMALEAELGNEDAALSAERELATTAYTGPNGLTALLLARAMILTWNSRFREATLLLQDADTWNLSSHQHRLRTSLLAVAAAANRDIETALSALSAYESAANVDSDTHSMFARARALSLRYAMLAAAIIAKRDISQRLTHEAARGETLDAFKAFDDAIEAVKLHSEQRLVAALHALNAHSQQGTAKVIAAVTAGLFPSEIGDHGPLTTTETAVLRSLAKGLSNQAIASAQGRTVNTIRTHVSSILRKLKCESRGEAAAAARRLGLV
jgi:DNA-binding CsgD family transcriptional regulator